MEYKKQTKEEIDNIKVGDKFNFGDGEIREVVSFSETSYLSNGKKQKLIDSVCENEIKSFYPHVFVSSTRETYSKDVLKCSGCGALKDKEDMEQKSIISRNWKENNFRSPLRNYCKGTSCHTHDQMAHEG